MKDAGKILASTHLFLASFITEGLNAFEVDRRIHDYIISQGATPAFLGFNGYKYSSCISKNEEIVHGIPYENKLFINGDLISIDIGVKYKGYCSDAARSYLIGDVSDQVKHLATVTEASFFEGISGIGPGSKMGALSNSIQTYVEKNGLTIVKDLYSHGIGEELHEEPLIPNYGKRNRGITLEPGMTFAIEPMVNIGTKEIVVLEDNWTIVTADSKFSAHYENTILITDSGVDILTLDS